MLRGTGRPAGVETVSVCRTRRGIARPFGSAMSNHTYTRCTLPSLPSNRCGVDIVDITSGV